MSESYGPCYACGAKCDGGVCDSRCAEEAKQIYAENHAVAFMVEREYDIEGGESGPAEATVSRDYWCPSCTHLDRPETATPLTKEDLESHYEDYPLPFVFSCYSCGKDLARPATKPVTVTS